MSTAAGGLGQNLLMPLPPTQAHLASAPPPGPAWQAMGHGAPEPPRRGSCARRGPRDPGWGRHRRRSLGSCARLGREAGQEFPEAPDPREGRRGGGLTRMWATEGKQGLGVGAHSP